MYHYLAEAVDWMMKGGSTRSNFIPLLWTSRRDWETCSAWTRGVVSSERRAFCFYEAQMFFPAGSTLRKEVQEGRHPPLLLPVRRFPGSPNSCTRTSLSLQMVVEGHKHHQQARAQEMDNFLAELGLQPDQQLHSLAHFPSPSLTARQARRSAVTEQELRARWACG